ncbi:NAD(P)-dependent oxidoreductase [Burkholderia multivorans]|nr:NAD(P)-dependent oxidoreductase [Burkholderia multivorans]
MNEATNPKNASYGGNRTPTSTARVGVVGTGRMGAAFAANLLEDGFEVVLFDRDRRKAEAAAQGLGVSSDQWESLSSCDIVISMVPDDAAFDDAASHLRMVLKVNAVHISMSTISPSAARTAALLHEACGQRFLSAPVLGNPDLAAARELFILSAGSADALETCVPVLQRLGQRVFQLGSKPELANVFKLAGNVLTASTMQSLGEVLAFLNKAGIDPHVSFTVLTQSLFDGRVHKAYGGKIVDQRYSPPGMPVPLGIKDLRLALTHAEALKTPMPVASLVRDRLVAASARGWDDLDWSVLGKLAEACANT